MRDLFSTCLIAGLLLLVTACAPASDNTARFPSVLSELAVEAPVFEVLPGQTGIELFDPPGMGGRLMVSVGVRIVNPNDVVMRLRNIDYTVYAWGQEVGEGRLETSAILTPGASELGTLRVTIDVEGQPELLPQIGLALRGAPLPLRFEGEIQTRALDRNLRFGPLAFLHINVTDATRVTPPVVTFAPAASRLFLPQPEVPAARLVLEVRNPGDVGYYLFAQRLLLLLDEKPLALADLSPVAIPAKTSRPVELIFYPNLATLSPETQVLLSGALGGVPMAFSVEGQLRMDVLGIDTYDVPSGWTLHGFISGRD